MKQQILGSGTPVLQELTFTPPLDPLTHTASDTRLYEVELITKELLTKYL